MFPFNLPGPTFLEYFAVFAAVVLFAAWRITRSAEAGARPRLKFDDPYLIAYLRGGAAEALRVTTVALIDRGLLKVTGETLTVASADAVSRVARRIEKALLTHFRSGAAANSIFDSALENLADGEYKAILEQQRLLPDADQRAARKRRMLWAGGLLAGIAGVKLFVALSTGHANVLFLLIMAVIATGIAAFVTHPRLTAIGAATVRDLRTLFAALERRRDAIRAGGATTEAVMLAAVFGIAMLPPAFNYAKNLYKKSATSNSSCGSSCGSSSGSSCGGGGSGCGGCGGGD
jgi:uncharacterized protein (TIGR04222 family)